MIKCMSVNAKKTDHRSLLLQSVVTQECIDERKRTDQA